MERIIIDGNLGANPELKEVGSSSVCNFSIAHNRTVKGEKQTDWFRVAVWGKQGERLSELLTSGQRVVVDGRFLPRSYEKDGETRISFDINADNVSFVSAPGASQGAADEPDDDDDIDF